MKYFFLLVLALLITISVVIMAAYQEEPETRINIVYAFGGGIVGTILAKYLLPQKRF